MKRIEDQKATMILLCVNWRGDNAIEEEMVKKNSLKMGINTASILLCLNLKRAFT